MNKLVVLLALLCATQLSAFQGTITGTVSLSTPGALEKTQISVKFDEAWGFHSKGVLQPDGHYPDATVRGEATVDENGRFSVSVEFDFPEGVAPRTKSVASGRSLVDVPYVVVWLGIRHEQFQIVWVQQSVLADRETEIQEIYLLPRYTIKGSVVFNADRAPAAELGLVLIRIIHVGVQRRWGSLSGEPTSWKFRTNSAGEFEFSDEYLNFGEYRLEPTGGTLAFPIDLEVVRPIHARSLVTELGTLPIVPGGSLRGRVEFNSTGRVSASVDLGRAIPGGIELDRSGEIEQGGLPAGDHVLTIAAHKHWRHRLTVTIRPGETTDVGLVRPDPYLEVEVVAQNKAGANVDFCSVKLVLTNGRPSVPDTPFPTKSWQLRNSRDTIGPLRKGTWALIFEAQGYARLELEITLPSDGPVIATLEEGGAINANARERDGGYCDLRQLWAVREDSFYGRELLALPRRKLSIVTMDRWHPDVYTSEQPNSREIKGLVPGTYLVLARTSLPVIQCRRGIEVRQGETTSLEIRTGKPSVRVVATRQGVPAPAERLYLAVLSDREKRLDFVEAITDSSGVMDAELPTSGMCFAATAHDRAYLDVAWKSNRFPQIYNPEGFWLPGAQVHAGGAADLNFELEDPMRVRIALDIRVPSGVTAVGGMLLQKDNGRDITRGVGLLADGVYLFHPVPTGSYEVAADLAPEFVGHASSPKQYRKSIEVKGPGSERLVVEFDLLVLRVNLRHDLPLEGNIRAYVRLVDVEGRVIDPENHGVNERGQALIINPRAEEIVVVGEIWKDGRDLVAIGKRVVDPSVQPEVTVMLSNKFGTINVKFDTSPEPDGSSSHFEWQLKVFDKAGNDVSVGCRRPGSFEGGQGGPVQGVPVGVYRAVFLGKELQPATFDNVRVTRGQATTISVKPLPAGVLRLECNSPESIAAARGKVSVTFLNQAGEAVDAALPYGNWPWSWDWTDAKCGNLTIYNLQPGVATVVLKFEGYEEVRVPVNVQAGVTITQKLDLKKPED